MASNVPSITHFLPFSSLTFALNTTVVSEGISFLKSNVNCAVTPLLFGKHGNPHYSHLTPNDKIQLTTY